MSKQGILLVNLGSPDGPDELHVRHYLQEFLMDGRVIDLPLPLRWFLVNCMIIPRRAAQSAHAYRSIWTPDGSPLVVTGRTVAQKLETLLEMPVAISMRYRTPTVSFALRRLYKAGVRDLLVVPLFPQYAMSSYETAARHVEDEIKELMPGITRRYLRPIFEEPEYLDALSATASAALSDGFDHLLFSFHGLPLRHLRKADPTGAHCMHSANCCNVPSDARPTCYRAQCYATARGVAERLRLPAGKWSVSFQSRLGRDPWMRPYTEETLTSMGYRGMKKLFVMCPAFVADCLETLEEIAIRGRETFRAAGGGDLTVIPCLNSHPAWLDALSSIISRNFIEPAEIHTTHSDPARHHG